MRDADDFETIERERQASERMTGWNGSLALYVHDSRPGDAPRPEYLQRLRAARDAAAQRALDQQRRGLVR